MKELSIIVPVYNESEVIKSVLDQWVNHLYNLKIDFELIVYNDGSSDNTLDELERASLKYKEIKIVDKKNSGHGPTILKGYQDSNAKWIFQMDSDNEIKVKDFDKLWLVRDNYDFVIGKRSNRVSPLPRKIITFVSRLTIQLFYKVKLLIQIVRLDY